ncbi:MAG TPA: DUF4038 domain-containing protein [Verrucomicrobiae bacterium]
MNRLLLRLGIACALVATISGAAHAFPLRMSENRRYLVDQRGAPFFNHAAAPWLLFYRPTEAEVDRYLDDHQTKGFTTRQVHLFAFEATYANPRGEFPLRNLHGLGPVNGRFVDHAEASSLRDARGQRFPPEVTLSRDRGPTTSLVAPKVQRPETVHVILEVQDAGTPPLWTYRRTVLAVQP